MEHSGELPIGYWIRQGTESEWYQINRKAKKRKVARPVVASPVPEVPPPPITADTPVRELNRIPNAPVMRLRSNGLYDRLMSVLEGVEQKFLGDSVGNGP